MPRTLRSARRNYRLSALISQRAVREARKVRGKGSGAVAGVVVSHQIAQATTSQTAVAEMLTEQEVESVADAILDIASFTTSAADLDQMLAGITADMQAEFERLVESLVTDAARAAESVAVTVRPDIYHVRYVNPPCCARCAILAGRVYRWSTGFERHPGCDCSMIPTTVASGLRQDPEQMLRDGLIYTTRTNPDGTKRRVQALSEADRKAILEDGADMGRVINVRSRRAGLLEAGHALRRGGRPTPAGIYRLAEGDREKAVELLARYGYIRT